MPDLHLIDATYELFRANFALPSIKAPDGREVGAVYGLLSSMLSLLHEPGVTHVACATDHVVTSFRNALYPGYKTGEGVDPALLAQFPLAEEALRAIGLVVWPMVEFEADDALAAAVQRYRGAFDRVVICTVDKDLAQCVEDARVVMWDRRRQRVLDQASVIEKYGVPPASIPDLLALCGDTSDGFPGIPGWGAKSSAAVLTAYGTIDRIPDDPAAWTVPVRGAKRLAGALAGRRDEARLYRTLATLVTDVPLSESAEDLRWRGVPAEAFLLLCTRLGFEKLKERPQRWA